MSLNTGRNKPLRPFARSGTRLNELSTVELVEWEIAEREWGRKKRRWSKHSRKEAEDQQSLTQPTEHSRMSGQAWLFISLYGGCDRLTIASHPPPSAETIRKKVAWKKSCACFLVVGYDRTDILVPMAHLEAAVLPCLCTSFTILSKIGCKRNRLRQHGIGPYPEFLTIHDAPWTPLVPQCAVKPPLTPFAFRFPRRFPKALRCCFS